MKRWQLLLSLIALSAATNAQADESKRLTIVHTNDLHSHVQGFSPEIDYRLFEPADRTRGGWSRILTLIHQTKKEVQNKKHRNPL